MSLIFLRDHIKRVVDVARDIPKVDFGYESISLICLLAKRVDVLLTQQKLGS
jgi:hypothetical protein